MKELESLEVINEEGDVHILLNLPHRKQEQLVFSRFSSSFDCCLEVELSFNLDECLPKLEVSPEYSGFILVAHVLDEVVHEVNVDRVSKLGISN